MALSYFIESISDSVVPIAKALAYNRKYDIMIAAESVCTDGMRQKENEEGKPCGIKFLAI